MMTIKETSRKKSAVVNSTVGFVSLLIPLIIQFYSRKYFLEYLNVEYLGINGTFGSILGTLSLSELGIQTAVVYCLYKPLAEKNYELVNDLMNVLRILYKYIGILFVVFPVFFIPFLSYVLMGTEVTTEIVFCFAISAFTSACSYFLAYKRCLFFSDQKDYISKTIDLLCNVFFAIVQIILLVLLRSYLIFTLVGLIQIVISNVIIHIMCRRLYPFLHKVDFSKKIFMEVWSYTKNIIPLRLADYAYRSTSNLILSSIQGTTSVGLLGNYTILTTKVLGIANGMLVPIGPIIGNMLLENDSEKNLNILRAYTFVRLCVASILVVPMMIVFEDFISWWIGEQYVLNPIIKILLLVDLFVNIYYTACCDFLSASGLFDKDKNIAIVGAIINILTSVYFVYRIGMIGALIGIVTSQLFFWVTRSAVAFKYCIQLGLRSYLLYWTRALFDVSMLLCAILLASQLYSLIDIDGAFLKLVIGGVLSIGITILMYTIVYYKSSEFKYLKLSFLNYKDRSKMCKKSSL